MDHRDRPDDLDWLDLGPDPDEGKPPRNPRRHYVWYGAAAAAVVLALVLTRTQHGTNRAATSPGSPSRTVSSSLPPPTAPSVEPTDTGSFVTPSSLAPFPSGSPVQVSNARHRLLDVPADWELFARAPGLVLRIQLALGRVTTTRIPQVGTEVPVTFLVGPDRVIVRPQDDTAGSVVRDGKSATELPPLFRPGMSVLPGPDQQHLWADQGDVLALVTFDGRPAGARIPIPAGGSVIGSDGAGYVLLSGTGGTYVARPDAVHRVTSGLLLADGPTRWLTIECDDSLTCANVVTDRASGAHHTLDSPAYSYQPSLGTISPDGRTAALPRSDGGITSDAVDLFDLASGVHRSVEVTADPSGQTAPSLVWSPDSRWLFAVNGAGQVIVVNRATGKATPLGVRLPPVAQLAFRHRTG
jgi:hypothetical protein